MISVKIFPFCINTCLRSGKILSSFMKRNTYFVLNKQSNVLQFCASSNCTENLKKDYFVTKLNIQHLAEIVPCLQNDEKLRTIFSEIELVIAKQRLFPKLITADELKTLCDLETRNQRLEYLAFLFKKERMKLTNLYKKVQKEEGRRLRKLENKYSLSKNSIEYGIGKNTMLLSVRTHAMNRFYKIRLANATLFGPKIVLDLSYDPFMVEKEKSACVTQLRIIYSTNRKNRYPFDLHYCNADSSYKSVQKLRNFLPKSSESFITLTEESYLDIIPKEKLVYLSPHAQETLEEYDHNAVYVIGAFVDTVKKQKISFDKADSEGIKSYKLPLDDYVMWGAGTKSLTVNQVFEILLILKNTGSWKKAFEVIPTRKIRRLDQEQIEKQNGSDKIFLVNTS